jgi:hypothetical protein
MCGKQWLIKSKEEIDDDTGNNLYWSNEHGWTTKEDATPFSDEEKVKYDVSVSCMTGEPEWEAIESVV